MSIVLPKPDSHKGENGRVLVIGGSKLFHASIFWSAVAASKIVDIVHFSSPAMENNDLVRVKAKEKFWDGIVVPWEKVEEYIEEDDAILIGPGMPRAEGIEEGERETGEIVNGFLQKYPEKKWVVDGGALQEVDSKFLRYGMILTPHQGEWERLVASNGKKYRIDDWNDVEERTRVISDYSREHDNVTVLSKGVIDVIVKGETVKLVEGGNAGLTKGGSGDVLAGVVTGLYAKSDAVDSCEVASRAVKKSGERLAGDRGVFYSTEDVLGEISRNLHKVASIEN